MSHGDRDPWQRLVPVYEVPLFTRTFAVFAVFSVVGFAFAGVRLAKALGPFAGMNDAYAWGVWKTFNVMTLTALGSGGLAVGLAAWVFNRNKLHVVMRTALVTSFLFYTSGMIALVVDVGRPWNMYHLLMPWTWNGHSALLEVAVCMPAYAFLFLTFENVPLVLERFTHTGSERTKERIRRVEPWVRKAYPYMVAGAYVLPLMHQSSLGGLMLLAGPKVHPLWQSQLLPLLYVGAAIICGFACVLAILLFTCYRFDRPVGIEAVEELGNLLSWTALAWLAVRLVDVAARDVLGQALSLGRLPLLFHAENLLLLVPALVLRRRESRETPHTLFVCAVTAGAGGLLYRFVPTTIAFSPGGNYGYFPALPEVLMTFGFVAAGILGFMVAVRWFAILPGRLSQWPGSFRRSGRHNLTRSEEE